MREFSELIKKEFANAGRSIHSFLTAPSNAQIQLVLFVVGITLLTAGIVSGAIAQSSDLGEYNSERIDMAVARIFTYLEGSFGVLVMVASGLGAILSSAFGQYRAALGCLVVAVGAFILRSFASTFFNTESAFGNLD